MARQVLRHLDENRSLEEFGEKEEVGDWPVTVRLVSVEGRFFLEWVR